MYYDFFWPVFGVTIFFGIAALAILAGHLRAKRRLTMRQILSEERIKALEAGVPLPEVDDSLEESSGSPIQDERTFQLKLRWLRLVCLALGLFLGTSGIGMWLALDFSDDRGLNEVATMGFMPIAAGCGLLLFWLLTRRGDDR